MGLLVLIAIGAILGWLASILFRADEVRDIVLNIAVGLAAALCIGIPANVSSVLLGLTAKALLLASCGSIVLLAGFNLYRKSRGGGEG